MQDVLEKEQFSPLSGADQVKPKVTSRKEEKEKSKMSVIAFKVFSKIGNIFYSIFDLVFFGISKMLKSIKLFFKRIKLMYFILCNVLVAAASLINAGILMQIVNRMEYQDVLPIPEKIIALVVAITLEFMVEVFEVSRQRWLSIIFTIMSIAMVAYAFYIQEVMGSTTDNPVDAVGFGRVVVGILFIIGIYALSKVMTKEYKMNIEELPITKQKKIRDVYTEQFANIDKAIADNKELFQPTKFEVIDPSIDIKAIERKKMSDQRKFLKGLDRIDFKQFSDDWGLKEASLKKEFSRKNKFKPRYIMNFPKRKSKGTKKTEKKAE